MNILFVASYYPPYAPMAGTRIGKLTGYFHQQGHKVRVLGAINPELPPLLQPSIPDGQITYVDANLHGGVVSKVRKWLGRSGGTPTAEPDGQDNGAPKTSPPGRQEGGFVDRLRTLYRQFATIPDGYTGWRHPAIEAGMALIAQSRPDAIYASLPLHSGFLVASELARRSGVPLVVEYRDLWVDHPYYRAPAWRRIIENRMERRAARQVSGYVTVTEGWRSLLESKRKRPTELVLNGFDPDDFKACKAPRVAPDDVLSLFYAGALYGEKRDPTPLFEALHRMGDDARSIHVLFHTDEADGLNAKVSAFGLEGIVEVKEPVPQSDILAMEQAVDVLLLLRWDHPSEEAVLAGKLFEYIGAGRPILSVGLETGEAARLIEDNGLGLVSKDPDRIALQLRQWLAELQAGGVAALDAGQTARFSRDRQFEKLERFLTGLLATG